MAQNIWCSCSIIHSLSVKIRLRSHPGCLLGSLVPVILCCSAGAQERKPAYEAIKNVNCLNAIHQVHSDVENRLAGEVQSLEIFSPADESDAARSPLVERQKRLIFNLNTKWSRRQATERAHNANESLVSSPLLAKKHAETIMADCPDVGSVVFYMWEYGVGWSTGRDGMLVRDRCVLPSEKRLRIWGEMDCY